MTKSEINQDNSHRQTMFLLLGHLFLQFEIVVIIYMKLYMAGTVCSQPSEHRVKVQ